MKRLVTLLTISLVCFSSVVLFAGCTGCHPQHEIAPPIETTPIITEELAEMAAALKTIDATHPVASLKPPQPPDTYESDPYFYIQGFEYERLVDSNGGRSATPKISLYAIDEKQHARRERGVTAPTLEQEIVEILTEGLSPLDAAKFLHLEGSYPKFAMEYAQQALDANPDDYTPLHVWTYVQQTQTLRERGLRRLLSMNPRSAKLHIDLGVILFHSGREQEGINHLKISAVLDPSYKRSAALGALGDAYQHSDIKLALAYYKEAQRYYDASYRQSVIGFLEKGETP